MQVSSHMTQVRSVEGKKDVATSANDGAPSSAFDALMAMLQPLPPMGNPGDPKEKKKGSASEFEKNVSASAKAATRMQVPMLFHSSSEAPATAKLKSAADPRGSLQSAEKSGVATQTDETAVSVKKSGSQKPGSDALSTIRLLSERGISDGASTTMSRHVPPTSKPPSRDAEATVLSSPTSKSNTDKVKSPISVMPPVVPPTSPAVVGTSAKDTIEQPIRGLTADGIQQLTDLVVRQVHVGPNHVVVKVQPEGLGQITIRVEQSSAGVNLTVQTTHPETANWLQGQTESLTAGIAKAGVTVASLQVGIEVQGAGGQTNGSLDMNGGDRDRKRDSRHAIERLRSTTGRVQSSDLTGTTPTSVADKATYSTRV